MAHLLQRASASQFHRTVPRNQIQEIDLAIISALIRKKPWSDAEDNVNQKWFYISLKNLAKFQSNFPLFPCVKTVTELNRGQSETFEINKTK